MKKNLFDLTIEEFVRLLCDMEETHVLELKVYPTNGNTDEVRGTYSQLYDMHMDLFVENEESKTLLKILNQIKSSLFDYNMKLSRLDIYNYLEEKTHGFEKERSEIILGEMESINCMYIDEERMEYVNKKIENGWNKYKIREKEIKVGGETYNIVDYHDAYTKIYGYGYDFSYCQAIDLLRSKIGNDEPIENYLKTMPKELATDEAKKLLQKSIEAGLCDIAYKWLKSKALLAYFADKSSEYMCLGKGKYDDKVKTSWKPFEVLFNISGLSGARRDYQKTGTLPDGYTIVDNLFK